MFGFGLMTFCNLLMAVMFYFKNSLGLVIITIMYLVFFTTTTGPASFAFCVEVNTDISLGVAMSQLLNSIGIFALLTKKMIDSLNGNEVMLYSVFTFYGLLALMFSYKNVKETKGLTDNEQKTLYAPEHREIATQTTATFDPNDVGNIILSTDL